ncbi:MAG: aerotolerance regulator BatC [Muribaculaceae bacterium]|nr:aerotolerance regulator BatC [Muribaculaceae bacterium]
MRISNKIRIMLCAVAVMMSPQFVASAQKANGAKVETNKKERNYIRSGNKLFEQKRYADAEVEYRKALQHNPNSYAAKYNLASSFVKQGGSVAKDDKNSPVNKADSLFSEVARTCPDTGIAARAFYNMGNIAFNKEDYQKSVENYKNCLRRTPDDDQARENLRLAQKKLQEQQQNQQNQNQNQDQQQQQQQQQQNQDQNKDKDQQQKQDQQQDKQQSNEKKDSEQKKDQQNGGMSEANMDRILENMQNQENAVQQKVNAAKAKEERERSRVKRKQW